MEWLGNSQLRKYAIEGQKILAYCKHDSDPYFIEDRNRLTTYAAHCEGLGHVPDGLHVLVYGGEYRETGEYGEDLGHIPAWWFLNDDMFETVGAPVRFVPISEKDATDTTRYSIYRKEIFTDEARQMLLDAGVTPDETWMLKLQFDNREDAENQYDIEISHNNPMFAYKLVVE